MQRRNDKRDRGGALGWIVGAAIATALTAMLWREWFLVMRRAAGGE